MAEHQTAQFAVHCRQSPGHAFTSFTAAPALVNLRRNTGRAAASTSPFCRSCEFAVAFLDPCRSLPAPKTGKTFQIGLGGTRSHLLGAGRRLAFTVGLQNGGVRHPHTNARLGDFWLPGVVVACKSGSPPVLKAIELECALDRQAHSSVKSSRSALASPANCAPSSSKNAAGRETLGGKRNDWQERWADGQAERTLRI